MHEFCCKEIISASEYFITELHGDRRASCVVMGDEEQRVALIGLLFLVILVIVKVQSETIVLGRTTL